MQQSQTILSLEEWTLRAKRHGQVVGPYADAFVKRRRVGQAHPIHDFLFVYYTVSPLKLKQWVPSMEESLMVTEEAVTTHPWLGSDWFCLDGDVLSLRRDKLHAGALKLARWIGQLCEEMLQRPARFGCFGLHEWAMVYKASPDFIRHQGYPLRLAPATLASFVETQSICCSHYDAYRFFTKEAQPLNALAPTFATRLDFEQGGCVHANMDLYKWASKLWPWIGSDFIREAFLLALSARELDMRASPYDLSSLGYAPICIETEEGRRLYVEEQKRLAERSAILRSKLRAFCFGITQDV